MRRFHYYHTQTGELHFRFFICDDSTPYGDKDAKANAPADHAPIEGRFDIMTQRIDVATKKPVALK